jgi:hypothetical protein
VQRKDAMRKQLLNPRMWPSMHNARSDTMEIGTRIDLVRDARWEPGAFGEAIACADFSWGDVAANRSIWNVASILIQREPSHFATAASLVVSAVEKLEGVGDAKAQALARQVLAWVRPHMGSVAHLAGQIAIIAGSRASSGQTRIAAVLFELLLNTSKPGSSGALDRLGAPYVAYALYCALSPNLPTPVAARLQKQFLSVCGSNFHTKRSILSPVLQWSWKLMGAQNAQEAPIGPNRG